MKKLLLILLAFLLIAPVFAELNEFSDKGLISGWKCAPLQIGLGLENCTNLVDEESNVIFNIGLWEMEQKSAVFSLSGLSMLKHNYGISLALASGVDACYGIQISFMSASRRFERGGDPGGFIVNGIRAQIAGINIADVMQIGLLNLDDHFGVFQIGLINFCKTEGDFLQLGLLNLGGDKINVGLLNLAGGGFLNIGAVNFSHSMIQFGLLNYNPKSYIPWMPIVNFDMGRQQ